MRARKMSARCRIPKVDSIAKGLRRPGVFGFDHETDAFWKQSRASREVELSRSSRAELDASLDDFSRRGGASEITIVSKVSERSTGRSLSDLQLPNIAPRIVNQ